VESHGLLFAQVNPTTIRPRRSTKINEAFPCETVPWEDGAVVLVNVC